MSFSDTELLREFVIESQEHLADIENQLLTLESQGDNMDVALVNTVFRAIHSIKGAAGFMGLDTLGGLAHRAEEVLNRLRASELRPTSEVINALLRASDRLKELLDQIDSSNDEDIQEHLVALEAILGGNPTGNTMEPVAKPEATAAASTGGNEAPTAETLREFLVECHDHLQQIEHDLLTLESHPAAEAPINGLFRSMHSIKGAAGFLGFTQLERISHLAESLLGEIRNLQIKADHEIADCLLLVVDAIRALLEEIESAGCDQGTDRTSLIQYLENFLATKSSAKVAKPPKAKRKSSAGGKSAPANSNRGTRKTAAKRTVANATASKPAKTAPTKAQRRPDAPAGAASQPTDHNADRPSAPPTAAQSSQPTAEKAAPAAAEASAAESTIRVDVSLLDKLMTCVGELVLARNQILQFANGQVDSELHRTSQRLNLITTELQEGVMKTRMLPIGNVWGKFPRLVRDLASMCQKQVRIEMVGKETELDKTIIEAIKDPLTHLVRNTVDHGIEHPQARLAAGKPAEGLLTLHAYHEGGQVNIEIRDDGGGLNFEKIKAKAVQRGLVSAEQAARMPERDAGNLIFMPGFSTADQVSSVSGRGVGMDVVKTNIEKIGGTVDLQSVPGEGTTIKIKIPLTLAIIPALIVTCQQDRYAIPQVNLLELVRLGDGASSGDIEQIHGAPVYRLRGRLLPLVYLREMLGLDNSDNSRDHAVNIVVLRADDHHFGLVVDRILDTEEIVVKPLSSQLKSVPVYSGTTIMGDGKVALILDIPGLARAAHVLSESSQASGPESETATDAEASATQATASTDQQTLLVVGVGQRRRCAVPLAQVTRLEKIPASTVEITEHQEVVQYRNQILPLLRLASAYQLPPANEPAQDLDVLVYTQDGLSVGIVVDQIIDIVDAALQVTRATDHQVCTASAVVQGHVTDLLDLPTVVRQLHPDPEPALA